MENIWTEISNNPLLVLIVGAIFTGIFIPWITRRWQYKQKELELKTKLVSDITKSVMKTAMTIYLFNAPKNQLQLSMDSNKQQEELNETYKEWKVDSCIIGTKLHAYFPEEKLGDEQIHKKWDRFKDALSKFYEENSDINKKKDARVLEEEKEKLFDEKAKIIQEILASRIKVFRKVHGMPRKIESGSKVIIYGGPIKIHDGREKP